MRSSAQRLVDKELQTNMQQDLYIAEVHRRASKVRENSQITLRRAEEVIGR